jgi:serine/threonine protein kinase
LIGFYLADFNLSCKVKNTVAVAGTPQYAPLEFKLVREANQKSDIWQLGLICKFKLIYLIFSILGCELW